MKTSTAPRAKLLEGAERLAATPDGVAAGEASAHSCVRARRSSTTGRSRTRRVLQPRSSGCRPRRRQRRQQPNLSIVFLQKHLDHARCAAEVAVDLKRRMRVEHVRIRPLRAEQELQDLVRMIAVTQACPEVDAPRRCPTGGLVAANLERPLHRCREFRRTAEVDVVTGEEAVQVRHVPVVDLRRLKSQSSSHSWS